MSSRSSMRLVLSALGAVAVVGAVHAQSDTGPGVQSPRDSKYAEFVAKNCKNPPAAANFPTRPPAPKPEHREYKVAAIPGVIAAGQTWKTVWTGTGNNADGPIATADGGMLFAQNTNSRILKLDANGKESYPYTGTSTSGSVTASKTGELYVLQRALPQQIWQLEPKRQLLASMYDGEPIDCAGGLLNDMTADNKGGVYFTKGGVYHADAKGVVTQYGTLTGANGIILSPDGKTLYVTGRLATTPTEAAPAGGPPAGRPGGLVAYDVQADGSLTNERQFALVGNDGSAVDEQGRIYTTGGGGVQVVDKTGKFLGEIPSPLPLITVAFSGPDKKTLYGVANNQQYVEIFTIPMIAQGYKGRAK
jgi:sugar lactone lactonase YvrE